MKNFINIFFALLLSGSALSQTVRFEEYFDSLDVESRGWKLINNDGSMGDEPAFTEAFTFTNTGLLSPEKGKYFIHFDALNANDAGVIDQWVIMPQISNIGKFDVFTFWCGAVDNLYRDSLRVLISTSGNDIPDFAEIDRFKAEGPSGVWHKKSYDLSAYSGKDIYIAVNYLIKDGGVLGANSDNVWIDHFRVAAAFGPEILVYDYSLFQNYPNPFNPSTEIVFTIPEASDVQIRIYDVLGKEVQRILSGRYEPGRYNVRWNPVNLPSGAYFYTITAESVSGNGESFVDTKQMVFVK